MSKIFFAISVSLVALSSSAIAADTKVNMATVTCSDLSSLYADEFIVLGAWMSGYHNAKRGNTTIDVKELSANTKKVLDFCKSNPKMTVMKSIEQLASAK